MVECSRQDEEITHVVEDNERLRPAAIVVADGMEDTLTVDGRNKLLNEENEKNTADGREVEVVDQEQRLELEGLAVAHHLAPTEDDGIVDDDEDGSRLESRHGSLEGDELELAGGIADNGGPGLVEDGP